MSARLTSGSIARAVAADVHDRAGFDEPPELVRLAPHQILHIGASALRAGARTPHADRPGRRRRSHATPRRRGNPRRRGGSRRTASPAPAPCPAARSAARSRKNPRNGASPVPGPIMMSGVAGSSGSRKPALVSRTAAWTKSPGCRALEIVGGDAAIFAKPRTRRAAHHADGDADALLVFERRGRDRIIARLQRRQHFQIDRETAPRRRDGAAADQTPRAAWRRPRRGRPRPRPPAPSSFGFVTGQRVCSASVSICLRVAVCCSST